MALNIGDKIIAWSHVWKSLWQGWGIPRAWLIAWRVLNHLYYTNAHGSLWGVTPDVCPTCNHLGETIQHMFFNCDLVNGDGLLWRGL